jgi:hypothetical protein
MSGTGVERASLSTIAIRMAGVAATGAVIALATRYAYYVMFSGFAFYDDEGFLNLTVRQFVHGRALYDDVYSQYGPFFYVFNWAVFRFAPVSVDTDSVRLLVVGLWIGCASLGGLLAFRLTRNLPLALVGLALACVHLRALAYEPGHPQGLCMFLAVLLPATATYLDGRRRPLVCALLGGIVGCLLMTKINLGVFSLLALALTLSSSIAGRAAVVLQTLTSLAILVLPAVLMRLHIRLEEVARYVSLVTLTALPIVFLHWARPPARLKTRDGAWAAIGCAAAILVSCTAVVMHGTSLQGLVVGAGLRALQFPTVFYVPAIVHIQATRFAAGGLVAFVAVQLLCRRWAGHALLELTLSGIRMGYGVLSLYMVFAVIPRALDPNMRLYLYPGDARPLLEAALPFVWLVMIPGPATAPDPMQRFARALLAALAVLDSLQAYPVAGSQLTWATALVPLAGVVCIHDGLAGMARLLPPWTSGRWLRAVLAGGTIALLVRAQLDLVTVVRQNYQALVRLDLPGTSRLRLPEESVALYRWLALNLQAHADTFVGLPALDSLYFWSGKEPPTGVNPNAWMLLLDETEQAKIVDALAEKPNAVAVRASWSDNFYGRGMPLERQPLIGYLNREFQTVGRFRGYDFQVRKGRLAPELIYCAREMTGLAEETATWRAQITLPAISNRAVHRVTVLDISSRGTLADTQPGPQVPLLDVIAERLDGVPQPVRFSPDGLDLASPWRLTLRVVSGPAALTAKRELLVRLLDQEGGILASLPVLQPDTAPAEQ